MNFLQVLACASISAGSDSFYNYGTFSMFNDRQIVTVPAARLVMWERGQAVMISPGAWVGYGWDEYPGGGPALSALIQQDSRPIYERPPRERNWNPYGFLNAHIDP